MNDGDRSAEFSNTGVLFSEERAGRFKLALITLNSPNSLNALDLGMFRSMEQKLLEWRQRDDIACVVLSTGSERAFCAGGDVKSLTLEFKKDPNTTFGREFFAAEYFVDYLIHVYPKPILCWADGITMGGGVGIMNGTSHRVVTERTVLAMPEIAIGFFPDVGATYFLNRLPGGLGLFLGLTGARLNGFDVVAIRMADFWIHSDGKRSVFEGLAGLKWRGNPQKDQGLLSRYLARKCESNPSHHSSLLERIREIEALINHGTIEKVDAAFRSYRGTDDWIQKALQGYFAGSPTSAKTIWNQLKCGKDLSLKEAFLLEWDMAMKFCAQSDLFEGVRASLLDKDHRPRWKPATLSEVTAKDVERYLREPAVRPHCLSQKFDEAGVG